MLKTNYLPWEIYITSTISFIYALMITYDILSVIFAYMEIVKSLKRIKFSIENSI